MQAMRQRALHALSVAPTRAHSLRSWDRVDEIAEQQLCSRRLARRRQESLL